MNCAQFKSISIVVLSIVFIKALSILFNRPQYEFFILFFIVSPFLICVILNCIYEYRKPANLRLKSPRVEIRDKILSREIDYFDAFIERILLGKTIRLKNDPRGNTILFKSVSSISLIAALVIFLSYFIMIIIFSNLTLDIGKDLTFHNLLIGYFTIGAAMNALYLVESNKLKEKWNYLSERYNNILESRDYCTLIVPVNNTNIAPMNNNTAVLLNAWAIDALMLSMWGHRSFNELFYRESFKAVQLLEGSKKCVNERLKNSHFSEDELQLLLENYQLHLMHYPHLNENDSIDMSIIGNWLNEAKTKLESKR